jgi:hypothetical protein
MSAKIIPFPAHRIVREPDWAELAERASKLDVRLDPAAPPTGRNSTLDLMCLSLELAQIFAGSTPKKSSKPRKKPNKKG